MEKNEKRIEQLKLEAQVAVDEFNKIQDKNTRTNGCA